MLKEAFELPDPDEQQTTNELEIEITEDSVESLADGGEVQPQKEETEKPKAKQAETTDDDLDNYGRKVQKRITKLTKGYQQAQAEREEAIRVAQIQQQRIRELEAKLGQGAQIVAEQAKSSAQMELDIAKKKLKEAFEAGDADALADAQEAVADAKWRIKQAESYKPPLQQEQSDVQIPQTPAPTIDPRAAEWVDDNEWFNQEPDMTQFALGLDRKLREQGYDPTSDEYYDAIDARMRSAFPDYEWADKPKPSKPDVPKKPQSVVAPATRSTAPKKVTLSKSQVNLAKRLGITVEQYAAELLKMEAENG